MSIKAEAWSTNNSVKEIWGPRIDWYWNQFTHIYTRLALLSSIINSHSFLACNIPQKITLVFSVDFIPLTIQSLLSYISAN